MGKLLKIPLIKEYKGVHRDLKDKCLQTNCAMSVAATLTSKEGSPPCTLIGSWTVFNTKICDVGTCKAETVTSYSSTSKR